MHTCLQVTINDNFRPLFHCYWILYTLVQTFVNLIGIWLSLGTSTYCCYPNWYTNIVKKKSFNPKTMAVMLVSIKVETLIHKSLQYLVTNSILQGIKSSWCTIFAHPSVLMTPQSSTCNLMVLQDSSHISPQHLVLTQWTQTHARQAQIFSEDLGNFVNQSSKSKVKNIFYKNKHLNLGTLSKK